jgi:hypothetical protein
MTLLNRIRSAHSAHSAHSVPCATQTGHRPAPVHPTRPGHHADPNHPGPNHPEPNPGVTDHTALEHTTAPTRPDVRLNTVLSMARRRYQHCPTDYLYGVISSLSWLAGDAAHSPLTVMAAEPDENAVELEHELADSCVSATVDIPLHEFCTGISTSLAWARGLTATPPVR